jgi:ubiquinone/menaquinone biosynthesis C-methylase UbiE
VWQALPENMKTELVRSCNVCDADTLETVDPVCNIAQCAQCGYVFDNPRPMPEELVKFYSRPAQYDSWLEQLPIRQTMWERRLSKMQSTKKPGSLLDVGTGIGQFLASARNSYSKVYGTEVSSVAVRIAKEKYDLDIFQGTMEDINWQGKVFDNISLFHVLEHVHNPKSLLRTCHSLLSEDGVLVIAVPNEVSALRARARTWMMNAGLKERNGLGRFGLPLVSLGPQTGEVHLSHFVPAVLDKLLKNTGFSVLKKTLDPYYVRADRSARFKANAYYYSCLAFMQLSRINLYDAILVIARKLPTNSNDALAGEP